MNNQLSIALDCLSQDIAQFCAQDNWPYNKILDLDGWYSFYVRRAVRHIHGTNCQTFDLANLNVVDEKQGLGIFAFFLEEFKRQAEKHNRVLYVENVQLESHFAIYVSRGFLPVEQKLLYIRWNVFDDVCFFYDPCNIVGEFEV